MRKTFSRMLAAWGVCASVLITMFVSVFVMVGCGGSAEPQPEINVMRSAPRPQPLQEFDSIPYLEYMNGKTIQCVMTPRRSSGTVVILFDDNTYTVFRASNSYLGFSDRITQMSPLTVHEYFYLANIAKRPLDFQVTFEHDQTETAIEVSAEAPPSDDY